MIRECTLYDIDWLCRKATEFNAEYYDIPLDPVKLYSYISNCITSPNGVCLRSDHGAIVGIVAPDPVRDWTVLVETGWYSTGKDGLKLLSAFEVQGCIRDVNEIRLTTLETNVRVAEVLRRKGYSTIETSHRLILGG